MRYLSVFGAWHSVDAHAYMQRATAVNLTVWGFLGAVVAFGIGYLILGADNTAGTFYGGVFFLASLILLIVGIVGVGGLFHS